MKAFDGVVNSAQAIDKSTQAIDESARQNLSFKEPEAMSSLFEVWIYAFVIIAVVALIMWLVKRRNIGTEKTATKQDSIQVIQAKRISRKSVAYVLRNGHQEWLVVESDVNVVIQPASPAMQEIQHTVEKRESPQAGRFSDLLNQRPAGDQFSDADGPEKQE